MQFSPIVLLRQPVYTLDHLESFSVDLTQIIPTEEDIERLRAHFLAFIQSKHLLRSLPFSSKTLYQALPHYEFHAAVKIRKKEKQNERTLMKYLMRMALNASPLADFARTQFCNWEGIAYSAKANFSVELALSQRKEFFDLCYCDIGLQGIMRHRLNPSLRKEENGFSYIYIDEGVKSLVELEFDEQFDELYTKLQHVDFTFAEFVSACAYDVNEFLESQLISPSYPVYTDSDILLEIINSVNERFDLDFTIEELEGKRVDNLSDKDALAMQSAWIEKLKAYADHLEVRLNDKVYPERVFYLNSASNNARMPDFDQSSICEELVSFVSLISSIETKHERNISQSDLYLRGEKQHIDFDFDKVNIAQKSEYQVELILEKSEVTDSMPKDIGVMLQHTGGVKPCLINTTTANGKFFAPSLSLANEEVIKKLEEWIQLSEQNLVAVKDESTHSKNKSHSFLRELDNFGLDFHTPIRDRVKVRYEDEKLMEIDLNKKVKIVNLGIEDFNSRSAYVQNLIQVSESLPNVQAFVEGLQDKLKVEKVNGIFVMPRVETTNLVLGMQSWIIEGLGAFPSFGDTLTENILILDKWRKELGIPRIVKVSIDVKKSNYLDFHNFWTVDTFIRSLKNMESKCVFAEIGISDNLKGGQVRETYFEFRR